MKRILFGVLLGLLVLCPVKSMFSSEGLPAEDKAKIEKIDKRIAELQKAIDNKKGATKTVIVRGKTTTVRRRITKYDQAMLDKWEEEKKKLEEERAEIELKVSV